MDGTGRRSEKADLAWLRGVLADDVRSALAENEPDFVFQPIVDLHDRRIIGVEALARFRTQPHRAPDVWFAAAYEAGLGLQLEHRAIARAIEAGTSLPGDLYLAINVSPAAVLAPGFGALIDAARPGQLILEITEHARVDDYDELRRALTAVRERGVRIAIDDVGAGFASLQHVLSLDPDIIKLDRDLTGGVDFDPGRAKLLGGLIAGAAAVSTIVVAEGIESEQQLVRLIELGVRGGQGYFIARPGDLSSVLADAATAIRSVHTVPAGKQPPRRARPSLAGATIMMVDDSSAHRMVTRALLELDGAIVHEATTVEAARSSLAELEPDVVLLDARLPDGSGFELLDHIRMSGDVPVIFVTAATAVDDRVTALDRGADDYMLKPVSPEELLARVDLVLRRRSG